MRWVVLQLGALIHSFSFRVSSLGPVRALPLTLGRVVSCPKAFPILGKRLGTALRVMPMPGICFHMITAQHDLKFLRVAVAIITLRI